MKWSEFAASGKDAPFAYLPTKSCKYIALYTDQGLLAFCKYKTTLVSRKQDLMPLKNASPSVALSNCMAERDKSSQFAIGQDLGRLALEVDTSWHLGPD